MGNWKYKSETSPVQSQQWRSIKDTRLIKSIHFPNSINFYLRYFFFLHTHVNLISERLTGVCEISE